MKKKSLIVFQYNINKKMNKKAYLLLLIPIGILGVQAYKILKKENELREKEIAIQRLRKMAGLDDT